MKLASVDKLKIPDKYKEVFGMLLQMEVLFMELEGRVPRELEPLFERAYNLIGSRAETETLKEMTNSLREHLLSTIQGPKK